MLMTTDNRPLTLFNDYEVALALRRMASLQPHLPKYLLSPEVAVLFHYLRNERHRMLYATIWNSGARISEALTIIPEDLELNGPRPYIRLRTLKQRSRGRGRPMKGESIGRVVPLLDPQYVDNLKRYLETFKPGRRTPLFPVSRKTAWEWIKDGVKRAECDGVNFAISPISPKTFRHSYAMHLFFNRVPPKVVQAYMGHERFENTEIYLKVFALDVAPQIGIRFSMDYERCVPLLKSDNGTPIL